MTTKPRTRYVLDTNVLLYDPDAILAFQDAEVIIPITVIEEIDQFKKEMSENGRNARLVSKAIDQYRQTGSLSKGLLQPNGSMIRVYTWSRDLDGIPGELDMRRAGNKVLACALRLRAENGQHPLILVSQDTNIRIKANALGIEAISYEGDRPQTSEMFQGYTLTELSSAELERFRNTSPVRFEGNFMPNQGVILVDKARPENFLIYRFLDATRGFKPVQSYSEGVWGLTPRNPQQALALDLLLDPEVPVVTLMGKAGTGKTLLALAVGLQMIMDESAYTRLLVSRPIFPMGKDIGYLPGTAQEKLEPWMQPIFDNLDLLIGSPVSKHHQAKGYEALIDQGLIMIEPLTYIRGRSIPHQFMVVDEAQNLTPHEIKTIITRVGEGTKIVLTGDAYQIDNPYVDSVSNGLSHVVERFRPQVLSGHVTMLRGERSKLAELAANIL
ncbi:MAG: PhoH family protein [Deltaproteobacteria bacterium]|nr:PhoH family protein [Deltaproteobacteria bacterium]